MAGNLASARTDLSDAERTYIELHTPAPKGTAEYRGACHPWGGVRPGDRRHRLGLKPHGVSRFSSRRTNTEREVHPWAAGETGATEAERGVAPGDADPGAGARDARTRETSGAGAARTRKDTGKGSTSASTGWPNGWSGSKKRCVDCAAAGAHEKLRNQGQRHRRIEGLPRARFVVERADLDPGVIACVPDDEGVDTPDFVSGDLVDNESLGGTSAPSGREKPRTKEGLHRTTNNGG